MAARDKRQRAWQQLAELVDLAKLRSIYSVQPMSAVPQLAAGLLAGEIRGRVVIDVNA
jgi:NADPH:quinone reductase-like Zn-dependent oxidoreductase